MFQNEIATQLARIYSFGGPGPLRSRKRLAERMGMVEALRRFGGLRFLADTFGEFVERFRIELRSEDGLSFR